MMILFFVLGSCLGSFVNMLVYRTAVKYKLRKIAFAKATASRNRSFCDYCGRQLKWYENIPIISWIIQKGKSRCCQKKLPILYPIVELATGIFLLMFIYKFNLLSDQFSIGLQMMRIFWGSVLAILLSFLVVFDLKYMILPDFAIIILIILSFLGVVFDEPNVIPYLLSALVGSGFLWLLNWITKGRGMGFGDVKLAIFMGLFLGYPKIIVAFYAAFIFGAIVGIALMIFKKIKKKTQIPFGPFLILGTLIAWMWGSKIVELIK